MIKSLPDSFFYCHNLNDCFAGKVYENMAKLKEKFNKHIIFYK